jgi:hypothetical protein
MLPWPVRVVEAKGMRLRRLALSAEIRPLGRCAAFPPVEHVFSKLNALI